MEKAMSVWKEVLSSVLQEAGMPGDELVPSKLMTTVLSQSDPINSFAIHDQRNVFFGAIRDQFDSNALLQLTHQRPSTEEIERWVALMRWFIRELQEWCLTNDPDFNKLTALFAISMYCDDQDGDFWTTLPNGAVQNKDLICALERLIAGISCDFSAHGLGDEPIWEREVVEKFKVADTEEDWLTISELWPSLERSVIPNVFIIQAVQCLYRLGFDSLVQTLNGTCKTILATQFAYSLEVGQRFRLGIASKNPYIQFGCVFQTFFRSPSANCFDHQEQQSLMQLLLSVADDESRWAKWMQVFNRYPLRYPAMQQVLGYTLAVAPETAINAYVESIGLSTTCSGSRQSVAECLRAFRTSASSDRTKAMWRLAYKRWLEWQFEITDKDKHLFEIGCSELDFAVVAHTIECLTEAERDAMLNSLRDELRTLGNSWHSSFTDCITSWNRILSKFQPYAHASQAILLGEDWLMENKNYMPFEPQCERYLLMMFNMR